jgi:hypothetical protein
MAAWNMVLGDFKETHESDQQHQDAEAVFRLQRPQIAPS